MKKFLFTSATVLMIGLTAYAQDNVKTKNAAGSKCDPKECKNASSCHKASASCAYSSTNGAKSTRDSLACQPGCKTQGEISNGKTTSLK
jgi:hypothetical protein